MTTALPLAVEPAEDVTVAMAGMVDRSLAWITQNLDAFSPLTDDHRFDMQRMKRFLELAVMISAYVTSTDDTERPEIREAVALLESSLDERGFVDWLVRYPSTLVQYLHLFTAYAIATGREHGQSPLLGRALDCGFEEHVERAPHRIMEARMCLDWAGLSHTVPSWRELLDRSIVANPPSALTIRDDGMYALTHVVMFATRYGLDPPDHLSASQRDRLEPLLTDLLVAMCQEHHWDLVGELLFSWECLQLPSSPVEQAAWAAFMRAQEADGSFPPPASAERKQARQDSSQTDEQDEHERRFALRYHTTLVAIIAGCCHMRRAGTTGYLERATADIVGGDR